MFKLYFIFTLSFFNLIYASLSDARSMTQVAPGIWEVSCSNNSIERSISEKILNNNVCLTSASSSSCVNEARSILPTRQGDDQDEIRQIVNVCSKGSNFTHKCLKSFSNILASSEKDELSEMIAIILSCAESSGGVDKCIEFGIALIPESKRDSFNESENLIKACARGSIATKLCLDEASKELAQREYDELGEVVELIQACAPSRLEIDTCIKEEKRNRGNSLSYDQRKEVVAIISKCNQQ